MMAAQATKKQTGRKQAKEGEQAEQAPEAAELTAIADELSQLAEDLESAQVACGEAEVPVKTAQRQAQQRERERQRLGRMESDRTEVEREADAELERLKATHKEVRARYVDQLAEFVDRAGALVLRAVALGAFGRADDLIELADRMYHDTSPKQLDRVRSVLADDGTKPKHIWKFVAEAWGGVRLLPSGDREEQGRLWAVAAQRIAERIRGTAHGAEVRRCPTCGQTIR